MSKAESYKNWALEELMNYVKSIAEVETNVSSGELVNQTTSVSKDESYKNWALEELMNYVNSLTEIQCNTSYTSAPNQIIAVQNKFVEVEVTTISTEQEEIALSPSNLTNLMALIQDLQLSNSSLVKRVTYLSQAITEFHQNLEAYKAQFHAASSRVDEQNQKLAASYQTIQEQQKIIEKLTTELAESKELVIQVQADYNEQSYQLSAEKDNCRDLRTRLNREQQHSLQLKVALEKCLEVPAASYQLVDNLTSKTNNLEESASFTPKAPPIKTWTNQTRGSNQIDLSWERQDFPSQNDSDLEQTNDFQLMDAENAIAPEDFASCSSSITEDDLIDAIAFTDIEVVQVASPIETHQVNSRSKFPSPLVYPSRPPKGRKSLAAIELPSFVS